MSARLLRDSPWWALVWLGGCLNPQPDTNPLSPAVNDEPVDVSPASPPAPAGGEGAGSPPANANPDPTPGDFVDLEGGADAGPPPEPDAGASRDRIPVTFAATDAGPLQPDAGAPGDED